MTRVIAIASGKGGVGKTTSAVNIGAALALSKNSVVLVDADIRAPNAGMLLGSPAVESTLHDVLSRRKKPFDCIYKHSTGMAVSLGSLSASESLKADHSALPDAIRSIGQGRDIVIVDSAAGLGNEMISALSAADEAFVVTTPDLISAADSLKATRIIEAMGVTVSGVILNMVSGSRTELGVDEIESIIERPVAAVVPRHESVGDSLRKSSPVVALHPHSPVSTAYSELASIISGKNEKHNR